MINCHKFSDSKNKKSFTDQIKYIRELLSIGNPLNTLNYGSFHYKTLMTYNDIDFEEKIEYCELTKEKAKEQFKRSIQRIVKTIMQESNIFIGDIKAGIDERFSDINLGKLKNGKLEDYNQESIILTINNWFNFELIDLQILEELLSYVKQDNYLKPDIYKYQILEELIRNLYTLRWKPQDILNGFLKLRGNEKLDIQDTIDMKSPIKIDVWALVDSKFIECTNFYILKGMDNNGQCIFYNVPDNYFDTVLESLRQQVEKFGYNNQKNLFYKPYKMVKRMFSLSRLECNNNIYDTLLLIINGEVGQINQLSALIEVLILMMEKNVDVDYNLINNEVDNFKLILGKINKIKFNENCIYDTIDVFVHSNDMNLKIEILEKLKKCFDKIVKYHTQKFLYKWRLYPPPRNFLPKNLKYFEE